MYNKQKVESIKESAYFDYFKIFSLNAAETIRKLQVTIQQQLSDDVFFDANIMFKRFLLTSHSLYVFRYSQINDSCEFVQIPEFGVCLLKIFFQLMSIIRFMAKSMILRAAIEPPPVPKDKRMNQRHTMILSSPSQFKTYFNPISLQAKQRQNFRIQEMASNIFKDLNKEMGILQKQHKMMSQQNDNTFQKINKGREKLMEIQTSQSENMLSDVVNIMFKRGENISSFLNQIQTNINLQSKDTANVQNFAKLKEQYEQEAAPRLDLAKSKLNQLFKEYLVTSEQKRKQQMISFECQVKIEDEEVIQQKVKTSSHGKRGTLHDQVKTMKVKTKFIQEQNSVLKVLLSEKTEQYEKKIANLQAQNINLQTKLAAELKINQQILNIGKRSNNVDKENGDDISEIFSRKSCESQNHKKPKEKAHVVKRSKISVSKPIKSKVKFHLNDQNLQICTLVVNFVANYPDEYTFNKTVFEMQTLVNEIKQPIHSYYKRESEVKDKLKEARLETEKQQTSEEKESYDNEQEGEVNEIKEKDQQRLRVEFIEKRNENIEKENINNSRVSLTKNPHNYFNNRRTFSKQNSVRNQKHIVQNKKKDSIVHIQETSKRNSKVFTESNEQEIYIKASSFKQQKKQTCPTQNNRNSAISRISNQKLKNKMINCSAQTGKYRLTEQTIKFQRQDLANLFLNEDNAHNYELLNVSLVSKTNHYMTAMSGKHILVKQLKNTTTQRLSKNSISVKQQQQSNANVCEHLINLIYKYLKTMKVSKRQLNISNYHTLKNFIRFPFSAINRREQASWKEHERQNYNIQYCQLKKYINRIVKLHYYCKVNRLPNETLSQSQGQDNCLQNVVCEHWIYFFTKLGINLSVESK